MRFGSYTVIAFAMICFLCLAAACGSGDDDDSGGPSPDDDAADDTDISDDATGDDTADDSVDDDAADDTGDDDTADDSADDTADDDTVPPVLAGIEGDVYRFDPSFTMLGGAQVSVLERPDLPPVISDDGGHFVIENLHAGDETTLICRHEAFFPTQTATVIVPEEGLSDLTIMAPPRIVVRLLALVLLTSLDADACQIAVTVSPAGGTPFSPGIAGAVVSIDPPLDPEYGPFYFDYIDLPNFPPIDIPVRGLTETTDDGGAVFINVPTGDYVLSASMAGADFTTAHVRCRPGMLVNASPPYSLQVIEP